MSVDEQRLKRVADALQWHFGGPEDYSATARAILEAADRPEPPPYPTDAMVDAYASATGWWNASPRDICRRGIAAAIAADSTRQAIIDAAVALRDAYRAPPICADCFDAVCDAVNEAGL